MQWRCGKICNLEADYSQPWRFTQLVKYGVASCDVFDILQMVGYIRGHADINYG